jgi:hypothetical protein
MLSVSHLDKSVTLMCLHFQCDAHLPVCLLDHGRAVVGGARDGGLSPPPGSHLACGIPLILVLECTNCVLWDEE